MEELNTNDRSDSIRHRTLAVIQGLGADRLPFVDRLEIWYRHHRRAGTLPEGFEALSLSDAHRVLRLGEQVVAFPWSVRLHGVRVISRSNEHIIYEENDPAVTHFPDVYDLIPASGAGVVTTDFITPVGTLTVEHQTLDFMIEMGIERPYLRKHPLQSEADFRTAEYILERAEPHLEAARVLAEEARVGREGYVVPLLRRIPFQQLLLEYFGEEALFYALYDSRAAVQRLLKVLDTHFRQLLHTLRDLPVAYVEFCDNLEGAMTNPKLYAEYGLPYHQCYSEILHAQGKKVGSHTDGNLKPLLHLLVESGLDICESITPAPVTECSLEEILAAWQPGPIIWGGIPSCVLEPQTTEAAFVAHIDQLFQAIAGYPIILGIGDMVMPEALPERIRYIADRAAAFPAHIAR